MGFTANIEYAYIPRFIGLFGIDSFLYLELIYLLINMKVKKVLRAIPLSLFAVYASLDLLIHGSKNSFTYIRHELYTTYEIRIFLHHAFHCSYIICIALVLFALALRTYHKSLIKRDKNFIICILMANFFVLFTAIPDLTGNIIFEKCPSFIFCLGFAFIFFMCYFQMKRRASFAPSLDNVSKEIFQTIDVPILIFDMSGKLALYNSSAEQNMKILQSNSNSLRQLFTLRDVELLHIMAKAKKGENGCQQTHIRITDEKCTINYFVKLDYTGEPFCLITTVLKQGE